ncbi:MANSC domain-containing protein 1 [Protopterus annectens]|uniref:MANSC domain-containing protein 1 n=1 Tax=Protopterus annectens TaxID=7888 RepID=UPI001CF96238|nr:MANSC domain-containing protein 1 [Protopterus annectens]
MAVKWLHSSLIYIILIWQMPSCFASNQCSEIQVKNTIVDVKAALLKGVRSKDPVHVATPEACTELCCDGEPVKDAESSGRKPLNKKTPQEESDWDAQHFPSNDNITLTKSNNSQAETKQHDAHSDVQKNITVHLLHIVNSLEKNLDKIEEQLGDFSSHSSENQTQVHHPTKAPANKKLKKNTAAPLVARAKSASVFSNADGVTTGKTRILAVQHILTTKEPQATPFITPTLSSLAFTTVAKSHKATTSVRFPEVAFASALSQRTTSSAVTQPAAAVAKSTSRTLIMTRATTTIPHKLKKTTSHPAEDGRILSTKITWNLKGATRSSGKTATVASISPFVNLKKLNLFINETLTVKLSHMENPAGIQKSLVASLLFGVFFLALVLAIFVQRAVDSFRQRHYTKFDYLINGMYIGV